MIAIVARYRAAEGCDQDVAGLLREYAPLCRAEPGCALFVVQQSRDDPRDFVLYEHYRDDAALDAHRASPHFAEVAQGRIWPLLESREVFVGDVL